jgi:uncharacterized iron-regulated protein
MRVIQTHGRLFLTGLLLAGLTGCAAIPQKSPVHAMQTMQTGKFWDSSAQRHVTADALIRQALASDIVLLGETHDNPDHHALQLQILRAVADAGNPAALAMEQYDLEQQRDIDAILRAQKTDADKLDALRKAMGPGWSWQEYRALLAFALERRIPIVAANISRDALRQASRTGTPAPGEKKTGGVVLTENWSAAQQAQLEREIETGHCGMLPAPAVVAMSRAQRIRDAVMADRLLGAGTGRVIGILGRGHVRKDLGVPHYLQVRAPARRVLSVGLLETASNASKTVPEAAGGALDELYDYVAYTPARKRETDPCAAFVMPEGKAR